MKTRMLVTIVGIFLVTVMAFANSAIAADDFPKKPIRLIVPYNPGGGTDLPARALAAAAPEFLSDQPLIVSNKTGANGMIASKYVATQKPDGYMLLMGWGNTEFTFQRHVADLPIKTFEDFVPVMAVVKYTSCVAVPADSPIENLDDLVSAAKSEPGKMKWTHTGAGGEHYVNGIDFLSRAGIKMTEVPNAGGVKTRNLVASKKVDVGFFATFLAAGLTDKIKVIAIFTEDSEHMFPDVKTVNEQGYESINAYAIKSIAAPKGTPQDRITFLAENLKKALDHPAAQKIIKQNNLTPLGWGPEETLEAVQKLDSKYKKLIDDLGLAK